MVENRELRRRARQMLGNNIFSNEWIFALLVLAIAGTIIGVTSTFIVGLLIVGVVNISVNKYFLCRSRNQISCDNVTVFADGLKIDLAGNIVLGVLQAFIIFLWTLLLLIPGIIKSYAYSMAYFVKIDNPHYTAKQALDESERLMQGNKMKLFLLDLSFIGWSFLGALCFGVGTLWVNTYIKAAYTEFYRDLVGESVIVKEV